MFTKLPFFGGTFAAVLVCAPSLAGPAVSMGWVSWYGAWHEGRRTSSGCVFHAADLTAASPTLPFGTLLRLTRGDHSVIVQINDRGPYVRARVLDLSRAAADALEMRHIGVARVGIENLGRTSLRCRR